LHDAIDHYCDGLISHAEFQEMVSHARQNLIPHPEPSDVFTQHAIATILIRIAVIQGRLGHDAPQHWTLAPTADRMTGNVLLHGNEAHPDLVPKHDVSWIMPQITYDLSDVPERLVLPDTLPEHMRILVAHRGRVMSMRTADTLTKDTTYDREPWSWCPTCPARGRRPGSNAHAPIGRFQGHLGRFGVRLQRPVIGVKRLASASRFNESCAARANAPD
jgi:hypothetical protein